MESLYHQLRKKFPKKFRVNNHYSLDSNPCFDCVVRDCRSPEHCDKCSVNPDRKRLKKAGLL